MVNIGNDWDNILADEWEKPYYKKLRSFLKEEYSKYTVYPDMYDLFNALRYTSFENTKVVIIGQDPYHGEGQAHGLCFSVQKGVEIPPSLLNIYKEKYRFYDGFIKNIRIFFNNIGNLQYNCVI